MSNLFSKIGKIVGIIALSALSALLGSSMQHQNVGSTIPIAPSVFETYLASQMSTSDTSMTLASSALRDATTLNGYVCFTIDSNTSVLEYACGTATAGSQTITGLLRGIDPISGTSTVASLTFAHRRGADVKITDYPILSILGRMANGNDTYPNALAYGSQVNLGTASSTSAQIPYVSWVFNNFLDKASPQTVSGIKTFTAAPQSAVVCASGSDYCNKTYIDAQVVAGGTNASLTVKGISQEATVAQINAGTQVGSTGAELFVNPVALANSSFASTSVSKIATTSVQNLATTTISGISPSDYLEFVFIATSTVSGAPAPAIYFNNDFVGTKYSTQYVANNGGTGGGGGVTVNSRLIPDVCIGGGGNGVNVVFQIQNQAGINKTGYYHGFCGDYSGSFISIAGQFTWASTTQISSISVTTQSATTKFATSTYLRVTGY